MEKDLSHVPSDAQAFLRLMNSCAFTNAALEVDPAVWYYSDETLEKLVEPSKAAHALRAALWRHIGYSLADGEKIKVTDLCSGHTFTKVRMYQMLRSMPELVVWLLRPMKLIQSSILPLIEFALASRVKELVNIPLRDEKGQVSLKNAKILLRTMDILRDQYDNRQESLKKAMEYGFL